MKIEKIIPLTTQHIITFDRTSDPEMYRRCMWSRINLDHRNFTLSATTDCGNYSYSWKPTDSESFLGLMCRIEGEYLLSKISNCTRFDVKESKRDTIRNIENNSDDPSKTRGIIEEITNTDYYSEDDFFDGVSELIDGILDDDNIEAYNDYPESAKTFCKIFTDYLQPELRRELSEIQNGER